MTRRLKEFRREQEIVTRDPHSSKRVRVFAYAEDSETPYVIIREYAYDGAPAKEIWLEDCVAEVIIKKMQLALDMLPTSK